MSFSKPDLSKVHVHNHAFTAANIRRNETYGRHDIEPVPDADPDEPDEVFNSHLKKGSLGKSSGSCKVSGLVRSHRRAMVQEVWCASVEEFYCYICIAGMLNIRSFREQLTRVDYVNASGAPTHTVFDLHVVTQEHEHVLVSVKYDEKARRPSYVNELKLVEAEAVPVIADRVAVASRYFFHDIHRENARLVHHARLSWDPEADDIVLEAANDFRGKFTFEQLVARSKLENRGHRAAIRLLGDGDIKKERLDLIAANCVCWGVVA